MSVCFQSSSVNERIATSNVHKITNIPRQITFLTAPVSIVVPTDIFIDSNAFYLGVLLWENYILIQGSRKKNNTTVFNETNLKQPT